MYGKDKPPKSESVRYCSVLNKVFTAMSMLCLLETINVIQGGIVEATTTTKVKAARATPNGIVHLRFFAFFLVKERESILISLPLEFVC